MKAKRWSALAAAALLALALPASGAVTVTNAWWDVDFESPTPNGVVLPVGSLGTLTNKYSADPPIDPPYESGYWTASQSDDSYVTNSAAEAGATTNWWLELNTEDSELRWTPTNGPASGPIAFSNVTTLVKATMRLVGSDSEPKVTDFDADEDVQAAIYLRTDRDQETGETTNCVLCIYAHDASSGDAGWQELAGDGVVIEDESTHDILMEIVYKENANPKLHVYVDGQQMHLRNGGTTDIVPAHIQNSKTLGRVTSVSFRGTGSVDNFVGATLEEQPLYLDFTAEVYLDNKLVATNATTAFAAFNKSVVSTSNKVESGSTVAFDDQFRFEDANTAANRTWVLTQIDLVKPAGGSDTYTYSLTSEANTRIVPAPGQEDSNPAVFLTRKVGSAQRQTGVFNLTVPTEDFVTNSTVAKIYFNTIGAFHAIGEKVIGGNTTTNAYFLKPADMPLTTNWLFDAVDGGNLLSSIQLFNGATLSGYADGVATVSVDVAKGAFDADTKFVTATYAEGALAPGQFLKPTQSDNTWTFTAMYPPVAIRVSADGTTTNEYETLAGAVSAAQDGDTVELIADVTVDARILVTESMTIDLGGHTVARTAAPNNDNGSVFRVDGAVAVLITNGVIDCSGVDDSSVVEDGVFAIDVKNGAALTLADLEITVDSECGSCVYPWAGSTVAITSGTYRNLTTTPYRYHPAWTGLAVNQANKNKTGNVATPLISITGGSFFRVNPALGDDSWSEDEASFVAPGYEPVAGEGGVWTVEMGVYTLTYETAKGTAPEAVEYTVESNDFAFAAAPAEAGWTFLGWVVGDETNAAAATFVVADHLADTTATAAWSQDRYTIVFNDATGAEYVTTNGVVYGEEGYGPSEPPEKASDAASYYVFVGWTNAVAGGPTYSNDNLPPADGDATYTPLYTTNTREYEVVWIVNGVETTNTWYYDETPSYVKTNSAAVPEGYQTAASNFTFSAWSPAVASVTENATYTAVFEDTVRTYEITWKSDAETVIDTTRVPYGETPTHADPEDYQTDTTNYAFDAWDPAIEPVSGEATYTATWTTSVRTYEIVFRTNDVVYATTNATWHETGYGPADPADYQTETTDYTFVGWTNAVAGGAVVDAASLPKVTAGAEWTAVFDESDREYEVVWIVNGVETTNTWFYNELPSYDENDSTVVPDAYQTAASNFTFSAWSPAVGAVTGNATYTAEFSAEVRSYEITWKSNAGTVIDTTTVDYGETPTHADPANYQTDTTNYAFDGWDPAVEPVSGEATYTATWTETVRTYEIVFRTNDVVYATTNAVWHDTNYGPADPVPEDGYEFVGWTNAVAGGAVVTTNELPQVEGTNTWDAVFVEALAPEVDAGEGLDTYVPGEGEPAVPAPIDFVPGEQPSDPQKCAVSFVAPAKGFYVLMTCDTPSDDDNDYTPDYGESAVVEVTETNVHKPITLVESSPATKKFFKIGFSRTDPRPAPEP